MSASDVLKRIGEQNVKFVDLRFTDTRGKEQHVSVPSKIPSSSVSTYTNPAMLAAYTVAARVILNLDETYTKE